MIFKGGTCLAKVHARFSRLSEDLDFSIPTPVDATRRHRGKAIAASKALISSIPKSVPTLRLETALVGSNNSTQYSAVVGYTSPISSQRERIKIEVGLREPILEDTYTGQARTLILHPVDGAELVTPYQVRALSHREALAEKFRAALCRRTVAIRDFFDIDHAVEAGGFDPFQPIFAALLRRKLEVPGTWQPDVSPERLAQLERQVDTELRPVLRATEFEQFDLERAFNCASRLANLLASV